MANSNFVLLETLIKVTEGNFEFIEVNYIPAQANNGIDDYEVGKDEYHPHMIKGYKWQIFDQPWYFAPTYREALEEAIIYAEGT